MNLLESLSNVIVAFATAIYTILTIIVIWSNRKTFKFMQRRYIEAQKPVIRIKPYLREDFIYLSISNKGKSTANYVKFSIRKPIKLYDGSNLADVSIFESGLAQFIPGKLYTYKLGDFSNNIDKNNQDPIEFEIEYEYYYNSQKFEEVVDIDLKSLVGTLSSPLSRSHILNNISLECKNIAEQLNMISTKMNDLMNKD